MSTLKVTNLQHPSASNPGLQLDTSGVCYQLGMRNVLINGNPLINQRGYVSGTATTGANEYTLDRWRVVTLGQSVAWTDSNNVRTVTAPAGGVEQIVEGENLLSGTYTLSWTGTATATVDGNPVTNGGQVTLTGGTNAAVRFINGTFSLAQLERGSVVTPFEVRSQGTELSLCQRYYEVGEFFFVEGYALNSVNGGSSVFFKQTKRVIPTITQTDLGSRVGYSAAPGKSNVQENGFLNYRTNIGAAGGCQYHEAWTADAEL